MTKQIQIIERKTLLHRLIFRVEEARFRQELPGGKWSDEIVRLNLERGDSAAAIIHNTMNNTLILVEQFRYPTYENGPGWMLELPAGIIDSKTGESPEATIRRELIEEAGIEVRELERVYTFYPSAGGSSEKIHLFYTRTGDGSRVNQGGGLSSSGEFIRVIDMPVEEALRKVDNLEIIDAKTIIGLQWLRITKLAGNFTP